VRQTATLTGTQAPAIDHQPLADNNSQHAGDRIVVQGEQPAGVLLIRAALSNDLRAKEPPLRCGQGLVLLMDNFRSEHEVTDK
jgi:hypothetical protein